MNRENIIGDARARKELADSREMVAQGMEQIRKRTALQYMQELQRDLERNQRMVKLLRDCHARIVYANACENVVWGDRDLLQWISEEVMEAQW